MNEQTNANKERLGALAFYIILAFLFFGRAFLENRVIDPGDSFLQYYPLRLYLAHSFLNHGLHLWLPYEFLGLPFFATMQTGILYPPNWIYFILPTWIAFNLSLIIHYAFGAFFAYLYAREIEIRRLPALLAGIVFGLSGFMMAQKNHVPIVDTAIWFPLLLYYYEKIRVTRKPKYAIAASLAAAAQLYAGQPQMALYTYIVLAIFVVYYGLKEEKAARLRFLLLAALPVALGGLIALPQLVATKQLSDFAWRVGEGYDFFSAYSFHPFLLPLLVYPFSFGSGYSSSPFWILWNLTEMCGFTGSLPLVAAIWTLIKEWNERHVRFWGIVCAVAFFLVLGSYTPFYRIMYYVPVYNFFRVSSRNWMEFDFGIAILFAIGMERLLYDGEGLRENAKRLYKGLAWVAVAGLAVVACEKLLIVFPFSQNSFDYTSFLSQEAQLDVALSASPYNPAIMVPLLLIAAYAGWIYIFSKGLAERRLLLGLLTILVFVEAFSFGAFHMASWNANPQLAQMYDNAITRFLKTGAGPERTAVITAAPLPLFNVPDQFSTINGYDPLMFDGFHRVYDIGYMLSEMPVWKRLLDNNLLLSAAGVKYIVAASDASSRGLMADASRAAARIPGEHGPPYRRILTISSTDVYENSNCLPKAFLVRSISTVGSISDVRNEFERFGFDPRNTALLYPKDAAAVGQTNFSGGSITLDKYDTDEIAITAAPRGEGFLVLNDQYFPGWKAFVDGKETPVYPADGVFRGIVVPAGQHSILFRYSPTRVYAAAAAAAVVLIACLGALLF